MIKLRLLLLISIVINPEVNNIHILSFGKETGLFFSLVTLAQRLAQRFFPVTETSPIIGKVMKDKYTWAPFFFQGGSLILSYGGICYLGNISDWKKSKKDLIQTALTTNKIFLDLTSKPAGRLAQQLTFPLNCQVWALAESSGKQSSTNSKDVFNRQPSHGDLSKSFMDAFSYICYLDCEDPGTEDETVVDVANHILSSYMKTDELEPLEIELQDIEYLIALARQTEVILSPEAEELLQSYYRASRMTRSSGFSGSHVPPSAIHTLISLSVGLTKLKLSTIVSQCDAVMAIFLYEEYLSSRFGQSCLNCQPQHNVPWSRLGDLLGQQNDFFMQNFCIQLQRFCSVVGSQRSQNEE